MLDALLQKMIWSATDNLMFTATSVPIKLFTDAYAWDRVILIVITIIADSSVND